MTGQRLTPGFALFIERMPRMSTDKKRKNAPPMTGQLRDRIYEDTDAAIDGGAPLETMIISNEIRDEWRRQVIDGDGDLDDSVWNEIVPLGIWRHVDSRIRNEHDVVWVADGKSVRQSKRRAASERDDDGVATGARQRVLWHEFSWDQYTELADRNRREQERITDKVLIDNFILSVRDKHPDSLTPGEALRLEGLDPADFHIEMTG